MTAIACFLNAVLCGIFFTYLATSSGHPIGVIALLGMVANIVAGLANSND